MIDLYYWPTPNGKKIAIMLEECELEYTVVPVNIGLGDQFRPEFLKISPNNRIPAIVDRETGSTWNIAGEATAGELRGKILTPVPHFNKVFWFGWSLFKPGTQIAQAQEEGVGNAAVGQVA